VRAVVPVGLLVALALAGCSDGGGGKDDPTFDELDLQVTDTTGLVRGVVVDDAIRPLANATVTLRQPEGRPDLTTRTPDTGIFAFDELPAGTYFLFVARLGYITAQTSADVVAGVREPEIIKVVLAPDRSFVAPFYEQFVFDGFIECSTGAAAGGGYAYLSACSSSEELFPNDHFNDAQIVSGYPDWVQAEMVWESTQALSQSLAHNFHYPDGDETDGQKDLSVEGTSPLINTMDNATAKEYLEGLDFEEGSNLTLRQRIFTRATDGTGPALTLQQRFTVYVTIFYGYVPPTDWKFIESGEVPPPPA
jgi:hypothetical protein